MRSSKSLTGSYWCQDHSWSASALSSVCVYVPQCGLSDSVKDIFYDQLRSVTAMIPASEFLIPCGDWNGHVGSTGSGYKEVHGGYGYGKPHPDSEGERILEYAQTYDLFDSGHS